MAIWTGWAGDMTMTKDAGVTLTTSPTLGDTTGFGESTVANGTQRLPIICAFAGAVVFNLAGYFIENHVITGTGFAFKGAVGLVVGYAAGYLISRSRSGA